MPPYSSTARRRHLGDGVLVVTSTGTASARRGAVRGDELVGDLLRAVDVEVGDDDVRAARGEQARGARPIPLAPPVISATRPASSPRGGACASL